MVVFLVGVKGTREPTYQRRPLSSWLEDMGGMVRPPESYAAASEAIRHMGTNAIPFLLKRLQARDSAAKRKVMEWNAKQSTFQFHFTQAAELRYQAIRAFHALEPEVRSAAIPPLAVLLNRDETTEDAAVVLSGMGTAAFVHLSAALTNDSEKVRASATFALKSSQSK